MADLTNRKPILCLDFDGVCHSYTSGWKGADVIPDPPVDGLFEALGGYCDQFEVHIYSSRSGQPGGLEAMKAWFIRHYVAWHNANRRENEEAINVAAATPIVTANLHFPTEKPPATVGIDDRVITFTGRWPSIHALKTFQPWNKLDVSGQPVDVDAKSTAHTNEIRSEAVSG
jgi:hypothetical protein